MSGIISELLVNDLNATHVGAMLACGLAIKFMDDHLDQALDVACGRRNWAQRLGPSITAYSLVAICIAFALHSQLSLTLFASAYAIGMAGQWRQMMPSRLPGWLESVCALALIIVVAGWAWAGWGIISMSAIQAWDHAIDGTTQWPQVVILLLALALTMIAIGLHAMLTVWALIAALPYVIPWPLLVKEGGRDG